MASILNQIQNLDPIADHQRVGHLSTCYDFPFDTTRANVAEASRPAAVPDAKAPHRRTELRHASHPAGHVIEQLGPPEVV
jgi:hypothetical protein